MFVLPSIRNLKRMMSNIDIQPDFNVNILSALQMNLQKLLPQGLAFDGKRDSRGVFDEERL